MASVTLQAVLSLKDAFTRPLGVATREVDRAAGTMAKSMGGVKGAISAIRGSFLGLGAALVFNRIINASDELREKWQKYKESIVDAGPKQSIEELARAVGDLAGVITGSTDSAKMFGEAISFFIKGGTAWIRSVGAVIELFSKGPVEAAKNWGEAMQKLRDAGSVEVNFGEKVSKLTTEQIRKAELLNMVRADGIQLSKEDSDLVERWTREQQAKLDQEIRVLEVLEDQDRTKADLVVIDMQLKMLAADRAKQEGELAAATEKMYAQRKADAEEEESIMRQAMTNSVRSMNAELERTRELAQDVKAALEGVADIAISGAINAAFAAIKGDVKGAREEMRKLFEDLARWMLQESIKNLTRQAIGMVVGAIFGGGGSPTTSYGSTYKGTSGYGHMPMGGWSSGGGAGMGSSMGGGGGAIRAMAVKGGGTTVVNNYNISALDSESFESALVRQKRSVRYASEANRRENPGDVDR